MNQRYLPLTVLAVAALTFGLAWAASPPAQPAPVTNFGKKAPVIFDHALHAGEGFTCVQCHHNEAEGEYRCGQCHKLETEGGVLRIQDAFHGKDVGVCWSCHRAPEGTHKLKCNDCHRE
ncbi:MAG: cytochrome c3 family protein [Deferrisomatales bacterium]|nr:cytochrome c3 family protein [Deferrisomatales bacterium]